MIIDRAHLILRIQTDKAQQGMTGKILRNSIFLESNIFYMFVNVMFSMELSNKFTYLMKVLFEFKCMKNTYFVAFKIQYLLNYCIKGNRIYEILTKLLQSCGRIFLER